MATPLAAALIIDVMIVAIATVHLGKGPCVTGGGWEYNAVLIATMFALAGAGPGELSLDNAFGWITDITGTGWALGALGVGVGGTPRCRPAAHRRARRGAQRPPRARAGGRGRRGQRERPGVPADPR